MPVMLRVLFGSVLGLRFLPCSPVIVLRRLFTAVIGIISLQMIYNGVAGRS